MTYSKSPYHTTSGEIFASWEDISKTLRTQMAASGKEKYILAIECYQGVHHEELRAALEMLKPSEFITSEEAFHSEEKIRKTTYPDVTDDPIFGFMTRLTYDDFLDYEKVHLLRERIRRSKGLVIVYGHAASLVAEIHDCLVYADMTRWEIQLRQRKHEVDNLGIRNRDEAPALQYKRGYFVDWRVCDRLKQQLFDKADFWLDTNKKDSPRMVQTSTMLSALDAVVKSPFRVVPYFDPGPWGGQWMKEVCALDASKPNFAWSFDGVPEENSLFFRIGNGIFEIPAINLVFYKTTQLLGEPVESRFGKEFPIRFDFLDTMGGGNLSLQVHPTTQYIRETFGMHYTQDESYYILDAEPDAQVYLGLKANCDRKEMIGALEESQKTGKNFDATKYVNTFPAKKHDHFLIPNGTIHCSGAGSMVLEISATPYIFTFKLYDWGRMGLDGLPRAINIKHGEKVIQWHRDTEYCRRELVNQTELVGEGDGWKEERTGLHPNEFIETRRHWFTKTVWHETHDSVNVLNLVEGEEAIVESPGQLFEPYVVHYAETFIVPACVGKYTVRPWGKSDGKKCATIKAYVRHKA